MNLVQETITLTIKEKIMWTRQQAMENYNYWNDERTISSLVTDDNFFIQNSKTANKILSRQISKMSILKNTGN